MRMLKNIKSGLVLPWSPILATRPDMKEIVVEAKAETAKARKVPPVPAPEVSDKQAWNLDEPTPEREHETEFKVPDFDSLGRGELVRQAYIFGIDKPFYWRNDKLRAELKIRTAKLGEGKDEVNEAAEHAGTDDQP